MKKEKIFNIVEAAFIIAFGILIAVSGIGAAVNTYFGIVAIVLGVTCAVLAIMNLAQKNGLPFGLTFMSTACITIAIALFAGWLSFAVIVGILVFLIIALGFALIFHGIYLLAKGFVFMGVGEMVVGAIAATLAILYLTVPEFQRAFWIVMGVLLAVYGVYYLVVAIAQKRK